MWAKLGEYIVQKVVLSFLEYLGKYVPVWIADWKRKKQREFDQAKASEQLEKELAKPGLTGQEKADAINRFRNSGK